MSPRKQYKCLVKYMRMKMEQRDWHAVADAAMDIRELVAKHRGIEDGPTVD